MNSSSRQTEPPPTYSGGSFREFVHSWRYFVVLLGIALVIGLVFLEEDWRGHWAWNRYKRERAVAGDPLEVSAIMPPRVPNEENFAATPFLAPLFGNGLGNPGWNAQRFQAFAPTYDAAANKLNLPKSAVSNSWLKPRIDLVAWHAAFLNSTNRSVTSQSGLLATNFSAQEAAVGVVAALAECNPVFEELKRASDRPSSRFNLAYTQANPSAILLPHLAVLKRLSLVLQLRASAELALGQTDQAFSDVKLILRLADACHGEPFLISQLVRMAQFNIALQPFAEGLGRWSEPQLCELQERLSRFDFGRDIKRTLAADRVWSAGVIDYCRRSANGQDVFGGMASGPQTGFDFGSALMSATPGGWYDLEKLNCSRFLQDFALPVIDPENHRISPDLSRKASEHLAEFTGDPVPVLFLRHRFFARLLLPSYSKATRKAAFMQTAADTAVVACALERYRLARGGFPESLSLLTAEFIQRMPQDIVSGGPFKYRLEGGGTYVVYSVGWNQADDGGSIGVKKNPEEDANEEGDWVWRPL